MFERGCERRVRDDATGTDAERRVSLTEAQGAACQRDLDALSETDTLACGLSNPGGCGNCVLDPGEQCDDGNDVNGDGCSATCEV